MRRRKIIWHRLLLAILIPVCLIASLIIFISNKQKINRLNTEVIYIKDGCKYILNAEEFVNLKQGKLTLEDLTIHVPTINEFTDIVNQLEEEKQPKQKLTYIGEFRLTGYCNCEDCNGVWAWGPTYVGVMPKANHTIATDESVIPMGTHVMINGIEYVAEDTGSAIVGNKIDIYVDTHEECYEDYCNGYADVYIIEEV